jgi:hypothetical protein
VNITKRRGRSEIVEKKKTKEELQRAKCDGVLNI